MELDIEDLDGKIVHSIFCETSPTLRALHEAFFNQGKNPVGEIIDYEVDQFGVLKGFTPVDDGNDPL